MKIHNKLVRLLQAILLRVWDKYAILLKTNTSTKFEEDWIFYQQLESWNIQSVCFVYKVSAVNQNNFPSEINFCERSGEFLQNCDWLCDWDGGWRVAGLVFVCLVAARWEWRLELETKVREEFAITEKSPTRAFYWFKAPTRAFLFKNILTQCAKLAFKHSQ